MFDAPFRERVKSMTHAVIPTRTPTRPAEEDANCGVGAISRLGCLTGFAGAVFYIVGSLLPGSPPKPDAGTSQVVAFFVDKRGSLLRETKGRDREGLGGKAKAPRQGVL